jgi:hypothetical protein
MFLARVAELGGQVLEMEWLGARTPHRVRCAAGHICWPRPNDLQQGGGMCRTCCNKVWDVAYVVVAPELGRVKFGVTSNDKRQRLAVHRRAGYVEVVRVVRGLPDAHALERHVLNTLREAGIPAVQGREHFDIDVLALVLDVVDGWAAA